LDASGHPAVRLFADRAAAVSPGFEVHAANVGAVARICAALDGLPLAIELAAARLRSLTVEQVAARLDTRWHPEGSGPVVERPPDTGRHPADSGSAAGSTAERAPDEPDDRFRLLSRGDRTAAPRHRTLRAVVGWSWDLLSPPEQALARRLTVFAGGATLAAAERVCGLPAGETVELLADLTDKSLVEAGGGRYGMLDTVRAFGAEQLTQTGERERLRAAHAAYFLDLAQTADPHLRRAEQLEWLARLDAECDNLHAALRWAVRADRPLALRLVAALSWHGQLRGLGERAPLAAELLEAVGPEPPAGLEEEYALCVANAAAGTAATTGSCALTWHASRRPGTAATGALATRPCPFCASWSLDRRGIATPPWATGSAATRGPGRSRGWTGVSGGCSAGSCPRPGGRSARRWTASARPGTAGGPPSRWTSSPNWPAGGATTPGSAC
jgi:hypothetical protein